MKSTFIIDLTPGNLVDDLFALRKVELREFPTGKMISLEIGDKTGRIKGVIWSGSQEMMKSLLPGKVYRVRGTVTSYKGETQVTVERIELTDDYEPRDFLPVGPVPTEELETRLDNAIGTFTDEDYRRLLTEVFSGKFKNEFLTGVGGKLWHHNYIGGLAEHTFGVYDICCDMALRYPELDRDLLAAGALLHDIGKAASYSMTNFIDYSDMGRLVGHIVIGDQIINEAVAKLSDFPSNKHMMVRHLVLSHQGSYEQATAALPMMAEAFALYTADLLDSKLAAIRRIKSREYKPGIRWSNYVNLLERHIYFGDDDEEAV